MADTVEKLFLAGYQKYLSFFNKFYVFRYGKVWHEVDLTAEIRTIIYKPYLCCVFVKIQIRWKIGCV